MKKLSIILLSVSFILAGCRNTPTYTPRSTITPTASHTAIPISTTTPLPTLTSTALPTRTVTSSPTKTPVPTVTPAATPAISFTETGKWTWNQGEVNAYAWSPDGKLLAAGTTKGLEFYDASTLLTELQFIPTTNPITYLVFSYDGQIVAYLDGTPSVKLWSIPNNQLQITIPVDTTDISQIFFTPDGTIIGAIVALNLVFWKVGDGTRIGVLEGLQWPSGVTVSPDNQKFAVLVDKHIVSLWSIQGTAEASVLTFSKDWEKNLDRFIDRVVFAPDSRSITVTGWVIEVLNVLDGKHICRIRTPSDEGSFHAAFSADGALAATDPGGCFEGCKFQVNIWQVSDKKVIGVIGPIYDEIWSLSMSPNGQIVGINGFFYRVADGVEIPFSKFEYPIEAISIENGNSITLAWDNHRISFNKETGSWKYSDTLIPERSIFSYPGPLSSTYAMTIDGAILATCVTQQEAEIGIFHMPDGNLVRKLTVPYSYVGWKMTFSPDGRLLALSNSSAPGILLRLISDDTFSKELAWTEGAVYTISFSPDGKYLAAATSDQRIRLWQMPGGEPAYTWQVNIDYAVQILFSPRGDLLAATISNNRVYIWRTSDDVLLAVITVHDQVKDIAFTPDGQQLAIASGNQVGFWSPYNGKQVFTMPAQPGNILSLAFSPDGRFIFVAGEVETLGVWEIH